MFSPEYFLSALIMGYLLDLWLGDPPHWPHPIRWIGNLITFTQRHIRHYCSSERQRYIGGGILWIVIVGTTFIVTSGVLLAMGYFSDILLWLAQLWLSYTILATKSLRDAAMAVYVALQQGSIDECRRQLSYIVGRDTSQLEKPHIARATVETVAENSVDGVIAPLFYLCLGGVPLAMAYKAVNTLDSMVGYKTPKYKAIGCVSARMDDIANYIPARMSWLLLSAAAWLLKLNYRDALRIGWRDRYQHASPNCAWSEATVAGALNVRLGGPNVYFGEVVDKPWMGDGEREVIPEDIKAIIRMMYVASFLAVALLLGILRPFISAFF